VKNNTFITSRYLSWPFPSIAPELHLGISKPHCHISGNKKVTLFITVCTIHGKHYYLNQSDFMNILNSNPTKKEEKECRPLNDFNLYLRFPGHNEFWNETCGFLQPWAKVQSRDA